MEHTKNKSRFRRKECLPENVRSEIVTFRVTKAEKEQIKTTTTQVVGSMGDFLRSVAIGYKVTSWLDRGIIRDLIMQGSNMGRLGGLLKQQLSNPTFSPREVEQMKSLLLKLDEGQQEMRKLIQSARRKI